MKRKIKSLITLKIIKETQIWKKKQISDTINYSLENEHEIKQK